MPANYLFSSFVICFILCATNAEQCVDTLVHHAVSFVARKQTHADFLFAKVFVYGNLF